MIMRSVLIVLIRHIYKFQIIIMIIITGTLQSYKSPDAGDVGVGQARKASEA